MKLIFPIKRAFSLFTPFRRAARNESLPTLRTFDALKIDAAQIGGRNRVGRTSGRAGRGRHSLGLG